MWITKADLFPIIQEQGFLDSYKEHMKKDFVPAELWEDEVSGATFHAGVHNELEWSYEGFKDCVGDTMVFDPEHDEIVNVTTLSQLFDLEGIPVKSYGVCDFREDWTEQDILENLLTFYPELLKLGECTKTMYLINLTCVNNEDFRPHKNGGYKGLEGDNFPEHIRDGDADTYLLFEVMKLVKKEAK